MRPFAERYRAALNDPNVRNGLLGFQRSWRETRDAQIEEAEQLTGSSFSTLRHNLAVMKDAVITDLDAHVAQFRQQAEAHGAIVFEADTAEDANRYIADLCKQRDVKLLVKGKSMVSEEIELNDYLEQEGITAVETDLGEWILQLAHDRPSHLVMPAIHQRRQEVAKILGRAVGQTFDPDDIPAMVKSARTGLRESFLAAGVGLTGANALIAESGGIMLITNEGNGRMSSSLPDVHVVTAGIEKIVPSFADAIDQQRLLPRSATGQPITSYTTFISGPTPGHELHIVLLDNGRRAMANDEHFAPALRCIRCGACANVCPPYQIVGGHAFGHIYPGAIGLVTTPFHHGIDAIAGAQNLCVSCGACETVCPVEIPLAKQILHTRRNVVIEKGLPLWKRATLKVWGSRRTVAAGSRLLSAASTPLRRGDVTALPFKTKQTQWRTPPAIPSQPARSRPAQWQSQPPIAETAVTGRRVLLFLQCLTDRLLPEIAVASAQLLRAAGAEVEIRDEQHCCGLPAFDAGDWDTARRMARDTITALEGVDDIVTPAPSCVVAMVDGYTELFAQEPAWRQRAQQLAGRVHDVAEYLAGPARLPDRSLSAGPSDPITVHRFCQSSNMLGADDRIEQLISELCGVEVVPLPESAICCGFGGFTSIGSPEVSEGILDRKLTCIDETGIATVVTGNPGCILHIRGGAHASGRDLKILHIAEYLAARLPRDS
jgi:L-lactate dehydrogenase complex protein LldF